MLIQKNVAIKKSMTEVSADFKKALMDSKFSLAKTLLGSVDPKNLSFEQQSAVLFKGISSPVIEELTQIGFQFGKGNRNQENQILKILTEKGASQEAIIKMLQFFNRKYHYQIAFDNTAFEEQFKKNSIVFEQKMDQIIEQTESLLGADHIIINLKIAFLSQIDTESAAYHRKGFIVFYKDTFEEFINQKNAVYFIDSFSHELTHYFYYKDKIRQRENYYLPSAIGTYLALREQFSLGGDEFNLTSIPGYIYSKSKNPDILKHAIPIFLIALFYLGDIFRVSDSKIIKNFKQEKLIAINGLLNGMNLLEQKIELKKTAEKKLFELRITPYQDWIESQMNDEMMYQNHLEIGEMYDFGKFIGAVAFILVDFFMLPEDKIKLFFDALVAGNSVEEAIQTIKPFISTNKIELFFDALSTNSSFYESIKAIRPFMPPKK